MFEAEVTRRDSRGVTSLTLRELAAIFFRQSRLMAATFCCIVALSLVYGLLSPRYESHFRVLLQHERSDPPVSAQGGNAVDFRRGEITEEELNSESALLRDDDLLRRVVSTAGLVPVNTTGKKPGKELEQTVRKVASRLEVEPVRRSNLIDVRYRSRDPEKAAKVLSALTSAYMEQHVELHRPSRETAFFNEQAEASGKRLQHAEARLVEFTQGRGVSSAALERDIALQKLGEAEAHYRQITLDQSQNEQRIAALRQQLASFPARSVTLKRWSDNPQLLQQEKGRLLELQLRRAELLTRFQPSYALVREVERQIEETRQAIAAEALTPVRDETSDKDPNYEWARMELEKSEVEREALHAGEATAREQLANLRAVARERQSDSVAQQNLVRNAKIEEENYLLYQRKREEARIGDALDVQRILNVRLVEPPLVPVLPVHSMFFYLVLAAGLGLIASVAVAFIADYFDPTIRTPEEAQDLLNVPVLAWLPEKNTSAVGFEILQGGRRKAIRK